MEAGPRGGLDSFDFYSGLTLTAAKRGTFSSAPRFCMERLIMAASVGIRARSNVSPRVAFTFLGTRPHNVPASVSNLQSSMPHDGSHPVRPMVRGRAAATNPVNRFTELVIEPDEAELEDGDRRVRTRYLEDTARSVISTNSSPDVGFGASLNPSAAASTAARTVTRAPRTSTWASRRGWSSKA